MEFKWDLRGNSIINSSNVNEVSKEIFKRVSSWLNHEQIIIDFKNGEGLSIFFNADHASYSMILAIHHEVEAILIHFDLYLFRAQQNCNDLYWECPA